MSLPERRQAIRLLLDENDPADALAVYYAFYHLDEKTAIMTYPADAGPGKATGYLALSRTGLDLFRPFITMRLPPDDLEAAADMFHGALPPGAAVILAALERDLPLLRALFDIQNEETLKLFVLDLARFQPIINVLVTPVESHNGLPRFAIRSDSHRPGEIVASAGINWQTPRFAEITVNTEARYRRRGWGQSVVATLANYLLAEGRTPLYLVPEHNDASIQLAQKVGFVATSASMTLLQGIFRPRP